MKFIRESVEHTGHYIHTGHYQECGSHSCGHIISHQLCKAGTVSATAVPCNQLTARHGPRPGKPFVSVGYSSIGGYYVHKEMLETGADLHVN